MGKIDKFKLYLDRNVTSACLFMLLLLILFIGLPFLNSGLMIKYGVQPWFFTAVQLAAIALVLYFIFRLCGKRRPIIWCSALMAIMTFILILLLSTDSYQKDAVVGRAFTVAEFAREKDRNVLVFIGQQHVADLSYYVELDKEIGRLTEQGSRFYYEDTDAFHGISSIFETITYDLPWVHFYFDLLHQPDPGFWPSSDPSRWEKIDLSRNSPQVVEAKRGDPESVDCRIHRARDRHLLETIGAFSGERLAVIYGAMHLANIYQGLLEQGWEERSVRLLPEGRKPVDLKGYCNTDVDLKRLQPFANRIGAKIIATGVQ